MGIFRLSSVWLKTYKQCITKKKIKNSNIHSTESFFIDCNSLLHPTCAKVFEKNPNASFEDSYLAICLYISTLIYCINPSKLVYIAIDGVAGLCKQSKQRKRRYGKAVSDNSLTTRTFNTDNLSVGTVYMINLSNYMKIYLQESLLTASRLSAFSL